MKNRTILQDFEWYLPEDGNFWNKAAGEAKHLAELGITEVWLPPAYKGAQGKADVGYGVYDMYDLGEFDQKGTIPTKYGTKDAYIAAIREFQKNGIKVLADIVFNHRMGADETEDVMASKDSEDNREQQISGESQIKAWTKFTFPGRHGKYSDFIWDWTDFDGVDWDENTKQNGIFLFHDKTWDDEVDKERGNFDYLMGADLDVGNPKVIEELDRWGKWYVEETGVDGFRLDAVKHIRFAFFPHWLSKLRNDTTKELPAVAEYWNPDMGSLCHYLDCTGQCLSLFDVPLHYHFKQASEANGNYDMRHILQDTLMTKRPDYAVTIVDNHDTQPGQALQSWVREWFKPLAYALILLRREGTPCVFYGDLYGIPHDNIAPVEGLETLLKLRQSHAYGRQTDYFDDPHMIGWTRSGEKGVKNSGMAVLMTDNTAGNKRMCVGIEHAGETFVDALGHREDEVLLDEVGCGNFSVAGGSVSVWIPKS